MINTSQYDISLTANTCEVCAKQRVENIHLLHRRPRTVLELCVGPSLPILEKYYNELGITVIGNDIDKKYLKQSPNMIIGDCFNIDYNIADVVVFGPPLSKGCSGKREDSLSIDDVTPSYYDFLKLRKSKAVLVLPGRAKATLKDRQQFYKLTNYMYYEGIEFVEFEIKNKVVKYYEIYLF